MKEQTEEKRAVLIILITIFPILFGAFVGYLFGVRNNYIYNWIADKKEDRILIKCEDQSAEWVEIPKCGGDK